MEISNNRIEIEVEHGKLIELWHEFQAILEMHSPRRMKDVRDKAEALRKYAKSATLGLQLQNEAAELRLRVERELGKLLEDLHLPGGDRRSKESKLHAVTLNLEDMGIQRIQSHRWQQIASVPDDVFEDYIRECNLSEKEITYPGLIRYVGRRIIRAKAPGKDNDDREIRHVDATLRKLVATEATFPSICIYPPWPNRRRARVERVDRRFFKRFIDAIKGLPIADLAAINCHVHLWTTSESLRHGMRLLQAWGFTYRDVLVCGKKELEYGSYYHIAQDFLLLGTKGDRVFNRQDVPSLIDANGEMINGAQLFLRPIIEQVNSGTYLEVFGLPKTPRAEWTIVGK